MTRRTGIRQTLTEATDQGLDLSQSPRLVAVLGAAQCEGALDPGICFTQTFDRGTWRRIGGEARQGAVKRILQSVCEIGRNVMLSLRWGNAWYDCSASHSLGDRRGSFARLTRRPVDIGTRPRNGLDSLRYSRHAQRGGLHRPGHFPGDGGLLLHGGGNRR